MYLEIKIEDFLNKNVNSLKIIDIRNNSKYQIGHIPNSINISKNELMFNTEKYLNKSDIYYVYCDKGIQSRNLSKYLNSIGYKVVSVIGGYESYLK